MSNTTFIHQSKKRVQLELLGFLSFFLTVSPGPRHAPLLWLALWEVISSEAEYLQPVGALVTPFVGLIAGNVEVARSLGAVTQSRLL